MYTYQKVRAYIDEQGYELLTISKKTGIPYQKFNAILNGTQTMFADDLQAICYALQIPPEAFLDWE